MALLALFPIINPVGAVASFATLTADLPKKELRCQARYTSLYVFAILAAFTILGSFILDMFHLELPAIQIAGGFVVAHSGYRMLVPASDHAIRKRIKTMTSPLHRWHCH